MSMWHPFPGFSGTVLGALIFAGRYLLFYFTKKFEIYNLDPQNRPLAFEPFLARYLRASEFVIGLATGSDRLAHRLVRAPRSKRTSTLGLRFAASVARLERALRRRVHGLVDLALRRSSARRSAHARVIRSQRDARVQLTALLRVRIRRADLRGHSLTVNERLN